MADGMDFLIAEYNELRGGIGRNQERQQKAMLQAFTISASLIGALVTVVTTTRVAELTPTLISCGLLLPYVVLLPLSWQVASQAAGINAVATYLADEIEMLVREEVKRQAVAKPAGQPLAIRGWETYLRERRKSKNGIPFDIKFADWASRVSCASSFIVLALASSFLAMCPWLLLPTLKNDGVGPVQVAAVFLFSLVLVAVWQFLQAARRLGG